MGGINHSQLGGLWHRFTHITWNDLDLKLICPRCSPQDDQEFPGLHADFACLLYSMLENKLPEDIVQDVDLGFALEQRYKKLLIPVTNL